jgi:hypothetical protein
MLPVGRSRELSHSNLLPAAINHTPFVAGLRRHLGVGSLKLLRLLIQSTLHWLISACRRFTLVLQRLGLSALKFRVSPLLLCDVRLIFAGLTFLSGAFPRLISGVVFASI